MIRGSFIYLSATMLDLGFGQTHAEIGGAPGPGRRAGSL